MIFNGLSNEEKKNLITKQNINEQSVNNADNLGGVAASEYMLNNKIIITNIDPGEGATVEYPDGTVILVYEK